MYKGSGSQREGECWCLMNHYKAFLWSLILASVALGRGEGCKPLPCQVLSPLLPTLQQFLCERMGAAWLEQPQLGEAPWRGWQDRPGLSVSSGVILKNKKNILKTGILKIKTSFIIHLPRDPLSKKLLMEVLYLAAIQLAKKCSVIHRNIKFSQKNPSFSETVM